MAKKKGKKAQKQVDWASPPASPKPAPEALLPSAPSPLPLSPSTEASDITQEEPVPSIDSITPPNESKPEETPAPEAPSAPSTEEVVPVAEANLAEEEERTEEETTAEPASRQPSAVESEPSSEPAPEQPPNQPLPSEPTPPEPSTALPDSELEVPLESDVPEAIEEVVAAPEPPQPVEVETPPESEVSAPPPPPSPPVEAAPVLEAPPIPVEVQTAAPEEVPTPASVEKQEEIEEEKIIPTSPSLSQTGLPGAPSSPEPSKSPEPTRTSEVPKVPEPPKSPEPTTAPEAPEIKEEPLEEPPRPTSPPRYDPIDPVSDSRTPTPTPERQEPPAPPPAPASLPPQSPPRPQALRQVVEDSRPPAAPTPPPQRVRPRHSSAFEDDDSDDDSLIQPRLRGEVALTRDPARGLSYPPQPPQNRLFASRVPQEHYNPQPPAPPPGYHPSYYPQHQQHPQHPQHPAPPYYHNHGLRMSQSGGYPSPAPYGPPSHASSPYQEAWGQYPPSFPPYGSPPMQRQDSAGSREFPMSPPSIDHSSVIEDDTVDVFSRISQAIPDLHLLLAKYKETHGQLGVREELLRRASYEQQEKLRAKDHEIAQLKEKVSALENKHSTEASRLRLEIGNMEEQMKELKEQIAETNKLREEAEATRLALHAAKASWEAKQQELEAINVNLEKTATEEKEKLQKDFDDWKTTATTKHDAETIALAIQFDKKIKEAEVLGEKKLQETTAQFIKEKDDLRSEHQRQQREREASFDAVRQELESKLSSSQMACESALKNERESREVWIRERQTLITSHQEDRDSLRRGWEEQRSLLETQHKKQKEESDKAWIELHAEANRRAEEEKAKVEQLSKEKEELQKRFDALKTELEQEKEVIKSVAGHLEHEKTRLEKLLECYGDVAEIKSRGDTYYLVSFSQLQKQIIDLATTHFKHLPVTPPPDVLANIPPGLPSFLGDTAASRQLRAAYITHTVSKMVTFRVFGPFLFSLGRRYDKADSLFASMSNHIREKSTRKEAIWRQQTLLAAFTSSGAKQRINTAAGTVVDEIVAAIKHFADPKEEEGIRIAVRRIVKLAAETWRFARLERELIIASMPAAQDEDHDFTGPEYWSAYQPENTPISSLVGTAEELNKEPKLLLRLFPVIHREPKHEAFRSPEDENPDEGCIYHYGLAMYDDAESVVARVEELRQAGLPPITNTSPTAADFPPPLIPPPSNELPQTPDTVEREAPISPPTPPPEEAEIEAEKGDADPQSPPRPAPSELSNAPSDRAEPSKRPYTRKLVPIPPPSPPSIPTESEIIPPPPPPPAAPAPAPIESDIPTPAPPPPAESEILPPPSPPPEPVENADPPVPFPKVPTENGILPPPPVEPPEDANPPPPLPPAPSESFILPPPQHPPPPPPSLPTESVIIPPPDYPPPPPPIPAVAPEPAIRDAERPPTPPSPLFAAVDEIDGLSQHRSRNVSLSRRSTGLGSIRTSNEELRKERGETTSRRTSGYAISTRSSMDGGSQRSSSSRYTCESRSAAIKGLYPNSPLAGSPPLERTVSAPAGANVLKSKKGRVSRSTGLGDSVTWGTSAVSGAVSGDANE